MNPNRRVSPLNQWAKGGLPTITHVPILNQRTTQELITIASLSA